MLPILACIAFLGCRDLLSSDAAAAGAPAVQARMLGDVTCTVTPRENLFVCVPGAGTAAAPGQHRAILGNGQIKMASANVSLDTAAHVFQATVTVQNLLTYPLGTPDGTTVSGIKVFYFAGPTVTAYMAPGDTGTVTVRNADSTGNFTAARQPYYLYNQILQPNAVSAPKLWQWTYPATVKSFSFQVKVFAATPGEAVVPDTPPDSIPLLIYADSNIVVNPPGGVGAYVKDVIMVWFTPTASREDRAAAVQSVGGSIIGGDGKAMYLVRVVRDMSAAPSISAARRMGRLPQVRTSIPVFYFELNYLRPQDGSGWERNRWRLGADNVSSSERWGLERIDAPHAWGCATGDTATSIGVVDHGFYAVADLQKNTRSPLRGSTSGTDHGTSVASILGAFGNDSAQMAGVTWRSHLALYDNAPIGGIGSHEVSAPQVLANLTLALQSNPAVVNLSMGANWSGWTHSPPRASDSTDVQHARDIYSLVHAALQTVEDAGGPHPLLVIAAGNDDIDAYWNGSTQVALDSAFRDRVLVVAATTSSDARQAQSNDNRAGTWNVVSLAAPGEGVGAINRYGSVIPVTGTSFSAPMVSGAAALLKSFDPRLSSPQLRDLLIAGAIRGGRSMGSIPILNVYESLRLAAQRPGAPLCGNRVWTQEGQLFVQRDTTPGAAPEAIFSTGPTAGYVSALHGGHRLRYADANWADHMLTWTGGSWTEDTRATLDTFDIQWGPSYWSSLALSHDQDTLVYASNTPSGVVVYRQTRVAPFANSHHYPLYNWSAPATVQTLPVTSSASGQWEPIDRLVSQTGAITNRDSLFVGTNTSVAYPAVAYAPDSGFVLVAVHANVITTTLDPWRECPGPHDAGCQIRDSHLTTTATPSTIYRVPVRGGSHTPLVTLAGEVDELSISDGVRRELTVRGHRIESHTDVVFVEGFGDGTGGAFNRNFHRQYTTVTDIDTCQTEYRSLANPSAVLLTVAGASYNTCPSLPFSFAPDRLGGGGGLFPALAPAPAAFAQPGRFRSVAASSGPGFTRTRFAASPLRRRR